MVRRHGFQIFMVNKVFCQMSTESVQSLPCSALSSQVKNVPIGPDKSGYQVNNFLYYIQSNEI